MISSPKARIYLISAVFVLISAVCIAKLFYLGVIHAQAYGDKALGQYTSTPGDIFDRGDIYLTKKDGAIVAGATLMTGYKLTINPKLISSPETTFEKINNIFPIPKETFIAKANKKDDPYEEIASKVPKDIGDKIKNLNLSGVTLFVERWRFYPGNMLASQTLGFVGYQGNDYAGRYGLERQYNDILSRKNEDLYVNFFAEVFSNINKTIFSNPKPEGDIVTTIEPIVQADLEKELGGIMKTWSAASAGGIIMNPKDGSIYAMAGDPGFDVNHFGQVEDASVYANPVVDNVYEMGSVIKPLVMAAGIDAGVLNAATTYNDKGSITLNNRTVSNFDKVARGVISMQEVLNQSLNTGMVFAYQKLGKERFRNYMLSYGLGEKTGVDLPNEAKGIMDNLNSPRDIEYATASFGQGIALSPIEAAKAFSALGNGGHLVQPHVVKKILEKSGKEDPITYPPGKQVLKPETSEEITRMLVKVVDTSLLAGTVKLDHYSVAAKTGTAQISKGNGGGYYEDKYLHSFFGYFPAYDPQFIVFLYVVDPKGVNYASHTLTMPFINTAKFLLSYYQVPPDR